VRGIEIRGRSNGTCTNGLMCRDRTWSGDMPLVGVNYITDYITNSILLVMRHQLPVHQQPYINDSRMG